MFRATHPPSSFVYNLIFLVDPNSSLVTELADEDNMIEKGDDPDSMGGNNFENQSTQAWDDIWLMLEDREDMD